MPDLDRLVAGLRCRDVLADLSEFLDGNLAPERVTAIQAHLAGCDTCARFGGSVGEIVAALIDGATTLKRFDRVEGRAILRAENPAYPDLIPAEQLEAQGVLVGLLRRGSR